MSQEPLGFVGLGNMGGPMAARLVAAGFEVTVYDAAGSAARAAAGARLAESSAGVAAAARIACLSLPDGAAVETVAREIVATEARATDIVVDFSTIGVEAARACHRLLAEAGIDYVDAPVSGGAAGARAGTLAVMVATSEALFERLEPVLAAVAAKRFRVGEAAGQGQVMKLLNNFLSATAMAATSEAVSFGQHHGLDPGTIVSVLNVSTGRNSATSDKFPNRILPATFDSGFAGKMMAKDMRLYLGSAAAAGLARDVAGAVDQVWQEFDRARPEDDFTRIYEFVRGAPSGG